MRRHYRLRAQADFQRVRREGRSWAHPLAVLWACRNELEHSRFGFSAGRSVGSAVARNQVKRRLREIVRREAPRIAPGWDVIFSARAAMAEAEFDAIALAVEALLLRAGLKNSRE